MKNKIIILKAIGAIRKYGGVGRRNFVNGKRYEMRYSIIKKFLQNNAQRIIHFNLIGYISERTHSLLLAGMTNKLSFVCLFKHFLVLKENSCIYWV